MGIAPEAPGSIEDGAFVAVLEQFLCGHEFDADLLIK
jgi:hypothetical protein